MRNGAKGYTLLELMIALSMSTLVLAGVMSVATSMLKFSLQGSGSGDVAGWTLVSLDQMNKELENATYLELPIAGTPGDILSGCSNWSTISPGNTLDPNPLAKVVGFYYCVASVGTPAAPSLLRYEGNACPKVVASCGTTSNFTVVARRVSKTTANYFSRSGNSVDIHYRIGVSSPTLKVDTSIRMNKSYNVTLD